MDENITYDKMIKNKQKGIKIIKISKEFRQNGKDPENIMLVNIGKRKVQYTLNYKISEKNILDSLKTIQTNPIYNEENKLYYSSHGIKKRNNSNKLDQKRKADIFDKNSIEDSQKKKDEEKSYQDIYNLRINVKKINLIQKKKYNGNLIKQED